MEVACWNQLQNQTCHRGPLSGLEATRPQGAEGTCGEVMGVATGKALQDPLPIHSALLSTPLALGVQSTPPPLSLPAVLLCHQGTGSLLTAQQLTRMRQARHLLSLTPTMFLRGKHSSPIAEKGAEAWKAWDGCTTGVPAGARPASLASKATALNGLWFWGSEHQH